jgi:hypothetical protein
VFKCYLYYAVLVCKQISSKYEKMSENNCTVLKAECCLLISKTNYWFHFTLQSTEYCYTYLIHWSIGIPSALTRKNRENLKIRNLCLHCAHVILHGSVTSCKLKKDAIGSTRDSGRQYFNGILLVTN